MKATNDRERAQEDLQETPGRTQASALGTEAIRRARWVQNSPNTFILKCCVRDSSAVLAQVVVYHFFLYHWSLPESDIGGKARSYHAALRRARKAVREARL